MSVTATICVSIVAIDKETSNVLLVEEVQNEQLVINVPSGHIEPGETPREAAFRELKEETGCDVGNLEFVGVTELLGSNGKLYITFVYGTIINSSCVKQELVNDSDIVRSFWNNDLKQLQKEQLWRNPLVYKKVEMARRYFSAKYNKFFDYVLPYVEGKGDFKQL